MPAATDCEHRSTKREAVNCSFHFQSSAGFPCVADVKGNTNDDPVEARAKEFERSGEGLEVAHIAVACRWVVGRWLFAKPVSRQAARVWSTINDKRRMIGPPYGRPAFCRTRWARARETFMTEESA